MRSTPHGATSKPPACPCVSLRQLYRPAGPLPCRQPCGSPYLMSRDQGCAGWPLAPVQMSSRSGQDGGASWRQWGRAGSPPLLGSASPQSLRAGGGGGLGPGAGADLPQPQSAPPATAVPTRVTSQSERLKSTGDAPRSSRSWLSRVGSDKDRARAAGRTGTHVADMGYSCRQSCHPRCVRARLLDHRSCARLKGPGPMRIFYF